MISREALDRCHHLNKQLEMYRAFGNIHGAAAVLREIQMSFPKSCPAT